MSKASKISGYSAAQNGFRPTHGTNPPRYVASNRASSSGSLQGAELIVMGSISLSGYCPVDLSGKSAGYRDMSAFAIFPALSFGLSQSHFPQHVGLHERTPTLADLCGSSRSSDYQGTKALCGRRSRSRSGPDGLCIKCPWNLIIGDASIIHEDIAFFATGEICLGRGVVIKLGANLSQRAMVEKGGHQYQVAGPVIIGDEVVAKRGKRFFEGTMLESTRGSL
jgi:hypothetical protein